VQPAQNRVNRPAASENLSGDEDALQHFRGLGSSDYACGRLADGLSACRI
jgi:hypothetical protein